MGKWILLLLVSTWLQATILDDAWYALQVMPPSADIIAEALERVIPRSKPNSLRCYLRLFMEANDAADQRYYAGCCLDALHVPDEDVDDLGRILLGRYRGLRGDDVYIALVTHLMNILSSEGIEVSASGDKSLCQY